MSGQLIVITGPSGAGKGTSIALVRSRYPDLELSISATTRSPREGEVNGKDYFFVDRPQFEAMISSGELLEWAEFAGNYYGTPRPPIEAGIRQGKRILLEIELQGARQVRHLFPEARSIFILPPSLAELERRLRDRDRDSEAAIETRLQRAREEIEAADEFDVQIVNDNLDETVEKLASAIFRY